MDPVHLAALFTVCLFGGMLALLEVGRRIGVRRRTVLGEAASAGIGVVDGALFALLGLLIAFTFSGASGRFDARRQLVVEETNAIGTAYLRLDVLAPADRAPLRDAFRRYVDQRLQAYRALPDIAAARAGLAAAEALQGEIWRQAVAACGAPGAMPASAVLLLPALNAMIDITTTRTWATQLHPPMVIFVMLFGIALASAVLAGYAMGAGHGRSWLHMLCFAAAVSLAVYVIIDMEFPRLGLIRVDAFDQALVDLRQSMK